MDFNEKENEWAEFDKVVSMLTPRFPRESPSQRMRKRDGWVAKLWTIGSVAAVLALVVTFSIKGVMTANASSVPASEIVMDALSAGHRAENIRVDFMLFAKKIDREEIYEPDYNGRPVYGTLYYMNNPEEPKMRIDWHDEEHNSILHAEGQYVHIKNGIEMDRYATTFGSKMDKLLYFNTLGEISDDFMDKVEIKESNDIITVTRNKDTYSQLIFEGQFSRKDRRLTKATVYLDIPGAKPLVILETSSIMIDCNLPRSLFEI